MIKCLNCDSGYFRERCYELGVQDGVQIDADGILNYEGADAIDYPGHIIDDDNYPRILECENCHSEFRIGSDKELQIYCEYEKEVKQ